MLRRIYREIEFGDKWEMAKGRLLGAVLAGSLILVASIIVVGGLS